MPSVCPQVGIDHIYGFFKKKIIHCIYDGWHLYLKSLFLCNRAFSVQKVHLLQSRVLRGLSVHV